MVHVTHLARALGDRNFAFCESLAVQVDNSVVETKPMLTSDYPNGTTPRAFGGRPVMGRSEAVGLLKRSRFVAEAGRTGRSAPTSLIWSTCDRFVDRRTGLIAFYS